MYQTIIDLIKGFFGVDKLCRPAEGAFNSFFVYVPIPADLATNLVLEGGEPAEALHVTLACAPNIEKMGHASCE